MNGKYKTSVRTQGFLSKNRRKSVDRRITKNKIIYPAERDWDAAQISTQAEEIKPTQYHLIIKCRNATVGPYHPNENQLLLLSFLCWAATFDFTDSTLAWASNLNTHTKQKSAHNN